MSVFSMVSNTKKRAWAQIDLDNAEYNYRTIKRNLKPETKICCVIKANAYGHSALHLARVYEELGAAYLAVSNIEEALQLRDNGIKLPILILGYTQEECANILAENNITQCVYSYDYGKALERCARSYGATVKIHIKLDTGMGRIGFLCRDGGENELSKAAEICRSESFVHEGVFTHFATADEGDEGERFTREQFDRFMSATDWFSEQGIEFDIKHCSNSAATFAYPEYQLDMVRAGVVLYGIPPLAESNGIPQLKQVMSLHSVISHIKYVEAEQSVSYGRRFTANKRIRAATVPIGYADGFFRKNGEGGYCLTVNGQPAKIIGRVCMDQLVVDVSDIDCAEGEEVTVFGEDAVMGIDDIARINDTIGYEVICGVGERVPRAFIKNKRIVEWNK